MTKSICISRNVILNVMMITCVAFTSQAQSVGKAQVCTEIDHLKFTVAHVAGIDPLDPTKPTLYGTAFYIDPDGYLLTCYHVVDKIPQTVGKAILLNGVTIPVEVVKLDRFLDLALLRSVTKPKYIIAISEENYPNPGLPAVFAGFPNPPTNSVGLPALSIKRCMISGLEALISPVTSTPLLQVKVDQLAFFGNSGGPLLSASDMVLIGVIRDIAPSVLPPGAKLPTPGGYSYATAAKDIRTFISDIVQKATVVPVSENQGPLAWLKFRVGQELRDHNDYLEFDVNLFESAGKFRESGQEALLPPFRLSTGIWEEIWFDSRSSRLFSPELLKELRTYYLNARAFNELLQARETIRLGQFALSSRQQVLEAHDNELLTRAKQLKVAVNNLIGKLQ